MAYRPTANGGCCKTRSRALGDRHWGHWRWLNCLPQARYARAVALWWRLYGVRPRGVYLDDGGVRLGFVK